MKYQLIAAGVWMAIATPQRAIYHVRNAGDESQNVIDATHAAIVPNIGGPVHMKSYSARP